MDFPDYFPAQCPPETAHSYEGPFFRLARENPQDVQDEANHKNRLQLLMETGNRKYQYPEGLDCQACALSGYLTEEDLREYIALELQRAPKFGRKLEASAVFSLELRHSDGKLLCTPGTSAKHHSFWVSLGLNIKERLAV